MRRKHFDIICVVTNDLTQERRMLRICNSLSKMGWSVLLLGRKLPESLPLEHGIVYKERIACIFNSGPLFYLEIMLRFRGHFNKYDYDRILFVDLDTMLLSHLLRKKTRTFYLDLHEYFEKVPELKTSFLKRKIWSFIGKNSMYRMDKLMTVNDSLAALFSKNYQRGFSVIRNVPQKQSMQPRTLSYPIKTAYLGVLNPGRGLERIIELVSADRDLSLLIIGGGPLHDQLKKGCVHCPNIEFAGPVPPAQISAKLENIHFGWNLLEDQSQSYYYSLANKFFDYIAHGIPVITMDFPEYRNLIQKYQCGILLPSLDVQIIREEVYKILNEPSKWLQLHEGCHRASAEINWELEESKLKNIFNS